MNTNIRYSVLRYVHSRVYNEQVNVGVFVEYSQQEKCKLFIPDDFTRLNALYPDFRPHFLKVHLNVLKERTNSLNNRKSDLFNGDELSLQNLLDIVLRPDDTALEFSKLRSARVPDESKVESFIAGFIPSFFTHHEREVRHDETYLKNKFYRPLSKIKGIENKVSKDVEVSYNNLSYKIDFKWANGSVNLVKALSFDLSDKVSVNNKIAQSVGYLSHFSDFAAENNSRFDLLVAQPTNKNVFKNFDAALNILQAVNINKQIIVENDIDRYVQNTIDYFSHKGPNHENFLP